MPAPCPPAEEFGLAGFCSYGLKRYMLASMPVGASTYPCGVPRLLVLRQLVQNLTSRRKAEEHWVQR